MQVYYALAREDRQELFMDCGQINNAEGAGKLPGPIAPGNERVEQNAPLASARPRSSVYNNPLVFQKKALEFIGANPTIDSPDQLDPLIDMFHEVSSGIDYDGTILFICDTFAKMPDTKVLALCKRWEEKYPQDADVLMNALSFAVRFDPAVNKGNPVPMDLLTPYRVISESDASVTGVYNTKFPKDLIGRYLTQDNMTINGVVSQGTINYYTIGEKYVDVFVSGEGYPDDYGGDHIESVRAIDVRNKSDNN
jgi:hypothetical protein